MISKNQRKVIFVLLFTGLAVIASRINFSQLWGADNQFFTLFQFFGPIAGGFLGSILGPVSVFGAEIINFVLLGKEVTFINLLRIFPMVIAALYFGSMREGKPWTKIVWVIPPVCIAVFLLHPEGRGAWFFTLYWLIPLLTLIPKLKNILFIRSLGATFTAHAVGGSLWIWSTGMPSSQWIQLIPIVAYERLLFAAGIAVSYILFNTALDKISDRLTFGAVFVEKKYLLSKLLAK